MKYLFFFALVLFFSCRITVHSDKTNHKVVSKEPAKDSVLSPQFTPGPPAIVYKTKADYSNYVPVILSEDKSKIVSYPDPKDVQSAAPVKLKNGYLLDNRGINKNVAFLRWTYEEYKKFPVAFPR